MDTWEGSSQKDEDLDSWEGFSQRDEDIDPLEGSSQKDKDLNPCEISSQQDEDLNSCDRSSQERAEERLSIAALSEGTEADKGGGQELWKNPLASFNEAVDICSLKEPNIDILEPAIIMEDPTSSTNGKNSKTPYESSNKESDEQKQMTVNKDSAPVQPLKKTKKSKHLTVLECSYKEDEKIDSNQLGNDQSKEKSTDPVQEKKEEDLDSSKGSSQEDEDLELWEVSSLEDED
ncbi:hypothetical protein P7K49_039187 [Saguinus oedipus]|uniref:Uncharacterized protein n=1 Tax=Saguinus oedipus TaxID=9490 RepID=A0ABQ9TGT1_SAGOE|nr:hypothetical protein P7K49_039187 [Saguinus oedipus]